MVTCYLLHQMVPCRNGYGSLTIAIIFCKKLYSKVMTYLFISITMNGPVVRHNSLFYRVAFTLSSAINVSGGRSK